MAERPPDGRGPGSNILMLLILLLIIGAALFWAWRDSPPDAPDPSGTAAPSTLPAG
jgi:hypothetical protein